MAKKNRLKTIPETIVSILRDKKLNKTPEGADLTFFRAFLEDTTRYVPTNVVALSTTGNKVYSVEEAKVLEQDIKNRGGVSIEKYILADPQKAIKFINASYDKNDISEKVKDEMLADVTRNQNKWGIFSAMYTSIYGTISENVTSEYARASANIQREAIIVFSNLPAKIDINTAKEIITSHYSALKYLPFKINKDFVPTTPGRLILLTDNKLIRTGYVVKVSGKFDDLSNIEHWKVKDVRGPLTDYVDQVTLADRKDIAHLIFAETGKQILGIKEAYSGAKGLLTENEKDLLAILEELEGIAEASMEDAINTTSIVGGNIKNAVVAAGIPKFTDPVVIGAKKGIKLEGGYAVVPIITEDKLVIKEGQAIISSEAIVVVDMLTNRKDSLFIGVAANSAYNQQTQKWGEVNAKKAILNASYKTFFNEGSLSVIASLLGKSLAKIFNIKEVLTQVNREKRKSITKNRFNYKVGKAGKRIKHSLPQYKYKNNILYKATSSANIKKQKIKGMPYQGTVSIPAGSANTELLSIINANLRKEVIAKMKYPALVNNSGRFAGSVRAIDIINSQISVTFMKSPYSVFMQQGGKSPWNTQDRDPVKIINEAIFSISSKYNLGISKVNVR